MPSGTALRVVDRTNERISHETIGKACLAARCALIRIVGGDK